MEPMFEGEPILAVAAVDELTAAEAIEKIVVDYEPLPFVIDPLDSLRPGSKGPRRARVASAISCARSPALAARGGVNANRRNSPHPLAIRSAKLMIGNVTARKKPPCATFGHIGSTYERLALHRPHIITHTGTDNAPRSPRSNRR